MKKEREDKIRRIHFGKLSVNEINKITQVETILILDELNDQLRKLNENLVKSDNQSQKLEQSNYRLQWIMLILTAITAFVAIYPFIEAFTLYLALQLSPVISSMLRINLLSNELIQILASIVTASLGILFAYITNRRVSNLYTINLEDHIKLRDSLHIILRDKDGNIKEERDI